MNSYTEYTNKSYKTIRKSQATQYKQRQSTGQVLYEKEYPNGKYRVVDSDIYALSLLCPSVSLTNMIIYNLDNIKVFFLR